MAERQEGVFMKKTSDSLSGGRDFNVVVISHAATIAGLLYLLSDLSFEQIQNVSTCSISKIIIDKNKAQ